MARRDWASKKSHAYKAPRKHIRRDKIRREIIKRRIKIIFSLVIFLGTIGVSMYWIIFSPLFLVNEVTVTDSVGSGHLEIEYIVEEYLAENVWWVVPERNFFVVSEEALLETMQRIQELNPPVLDIRVQKIWPRSIEVRFTRRIARLRLVTVEERTIEIEKPLEADSVASGEDVAHETRVEIITKPYLIDFKGVVVDDTLTEGPQAQDVEVIPVIHYKTDTLFKKGDTTITEVQINSLLALYRGLNNVKETTVNFFEVEEGISSHMQVETEKQYRIIFSTTESLQNQVNNLVLTLDKIGEDRMHTLEYIDLRIEGRAYACCNLGI